MPHWTCVARGDKCGPTEALPPRSRKVANSPRPHTQVRDRSSAPVDVFSIQAPRERERPGGVQSLTVAPGATNEMAQLPRFCSSCARPGGCQSQVAPGQPCLCPRIFCDA